MIKVKINPINILGFAAVVAFSILAYTGSEIEIPTSLWVFFTVVVMGLAYFLGYVARWFDDWVRKL